jgi:hypothetical protein
MTICIEQAMKGTHDDDDDDDDDDNDDECFEYRSSRSVQTHLFRELWSRISLINDMTYTKTL